MIKVLTKIRDHAVFLYQSLTYHIAIEVRAILKQQIGGRYLVGLATRERQATFKGAALEATPYRAYGGWNMGGDH